MEIPTSARVSLYLYIHIYIYKYFFVLYLLVICMVKQATDAPLLIVFKFQTIVQEVTSMLWTKLLVEMVLLCRANPWPLAAATPVFQKLRGDHRALCWQKHSHNAINAVGDVANEQKNIYAGLCDINHTLKATCDDNVTQFLWTIEHHSICLV